MEENKSQVFDYIQVKVVCDKTKAEARYIHEYNNNINGIKDAHISFNQWLAEREIEALAETISLY